MSYKILLPSKMLKNLYLMRKYCGGPPIIQSVRKAVEKYLEEFELEIGTSIQDAAEAIAKHEYEQRSDDQA